MGRAAIFSFVCLALLGGMPRSASPAVAPRAGGKSFVAALGVAGLPEVGIARQEVERRSQTVQPGEQQASPDLDRVRLEHRQEIARLRAELDRIVAETRTLAESWHRRFHDLSTWVQMLIAVQILVLGAIVAALMVILQRLGALERSGSRPDPAQPALPLETKLAPRGR